MRSSASIAPEAIVIERFFDVPRSTVFEHWVDPREVAEWFAPDGFTVVHCEMNPILGGRWRIDFRGADGRVHTERGAFMEIVPSERIVFTLSQSSEGNTGPATTVVVTFRDVDGGTLMRFEQTGYTSTAVRDGNAQGWLECFQKLARRLDSTPPL
jgi:uncharacterized protein YndB with AHSA1/START domain